MTEEHPVAFVDIETTGLDARVHHPWEVALILPGGTEWVWQLELPDEAILTMDPVALEMTGFEERRSANTVTRDAFADAFTQLTRGLHLAGAVVSFDEERIRRLCWEAGIDPGWHYHLIDVENLVVGFLTGVARMGGQGWLEWSPSPPWVSEELSRLVHVDPADFDRHTALGDARWAKALYEAVTPRGDDA